MARDSKYMDNKWDIKFPKIYKERLQMADIGGVGSITYKKVIYSGYKYVASDDGQFIVPTSKKPVINPQEDYDLTGEKILIEVCNLARDINLFDVDYTLPDENKKEIRRARKTSYVDLIIDWCSTHLHPYDIEDLYEKYHVGRDNVEPVAFDDGFDGSFKLPDFVRDLAYVNGVFTAYYALIETINGNPYRAYELYKEGRYFDTLDIFEKYKYTITYDDYNEDPNWDVIKAMQESNKHQHIKENNMTEFKNAVIADKDNILQFLSSMIPDLKMTLLYKNNKVAFTANVNSIFDICWYTIARFIATNSGSLDLDLSVDTENFRSTHVGVCRSCGRWMEMKSNRQLYCDREDCQKDRNRRKQKEFQLRKKINQ